MRGALLADLLLMMTILNVWLVRVRFMFLTRGVRVVTLLCVGTMMSTLRGWATVKVLAVVYW